jgi:hypothetical protein
MKAIGRMQMHDGTEIEAHFVIPFVPVAGHMLAVHPEGDFLRVVEVMWHAGEPDLLDIELEEAPPHPRAFSYWKSQGWKKTVFGEIKHG